MSVDLPAGEREAVVREANRAPSVHNVQPTRWRFVPGEVRLRLDPARGLPVGDPDGHDAAFSLGCVLEGTRIALARRGLGADPHHGADENGATATLRLREAAPDERAVADRDHDRMERRRTHRLGFAVATNADRAVLHDWADGRSDATVVTDERRMGEIAALNDEASLRFMRRRDYRGELLGWMRLRTGDARLARDGLGAAALGMARLEAWAASVMLGPRAFAMLDRLGLAGGATSERHPTPAAAGIAAMTMRAGAPRPRADVESGMAFMRATLALVALGHQTWPMGVLVDDEEARAWTARLLDLPRDRVPRIVLRVGRPAGDLVPPARVPAIEMID